MRQGDSLAAELPVTMLQAALGATVTFETLDGPRDLAVKAGTQPTDTIRLNGLGVPRANGRGRGDLHVVVRVDIPKRLSKSEAAKLRDVASERGEQVDGIDSDRSASSETHDRGRARVEARAERSKASRSTAARQRRTRRSKG